MSVPTYELGASAARQIIAHRSDEMEVHDVLPHRLVPRATSAARRAERPSCTVGPEIARGGVGGGKTVVLVGTLDTKGREYAFLRDRLHAAGVATILVDAGIMGPPLSSRTSPRGGGRRRGRRCRGAAGGGRPRPGRARDGRGATAVVERLLRRGPLRRVLAAGGSGDTSIAPRPCARCRSACQS